MLWKKISASIAAMFNVVDNITEGVEELSLIFKDGCRQARVEQRLDALVELKKAADEQKLSIEELEKVQAGL